MAVDFGKYQLLRKIASGGMGQVYLARTANTQGFEKLVVIKRILPHLVEDEEFLTMFFDEAKIAARLNHPNLVQIFELGEANQSHYLAMEYVPGEDLRRVDVLSRKTEPLPVGLICRIIADAAAGLDYAHQAKDTQGKPLGLVHRDVSPQNILVGFDGAVKLIDFGVAKAAGRAQHTATGILKGKYPYMSPEQVSGQSIDHRSDIFGLGVVFWEVLTGQRLFKTDSDFATMRLIADCQVPLPSKVNPSLPKALDAIVMKALTRDPKDRYPDAASLRLALEDFVIGERLPASSAHLVAYLKRIYGERVHRDDDPHKLDELSGAHELDTGSVPRTGQAHPGPQEQIVTQQMGNPAPTAPGTANFPAAIARKKTGATFAAIAVVVLFVGGASIGIPRLLAKPRTIAPLDPTNEPTGEPIAAVAPNVGPTADGVAATGVASTDRAPEPITVTLDSEPQGAKVVVAGEPIGVTPVRYSISGTAVAPVQAVFTLDGFEAAQAQVSAESAPAVRVQLEKKKVTRVKRPGLGIKTGR